MKKIILLMIIVISISCDNSTTTEHLLKAKEVNTQELEKLKKSDPKPLVIGEIIKIFDLIKNKDSLNKYMLDKEFYPINNYQYKSKILGDKGASLYWIIPNDMGKYSSIQCKVSNSKIVNSLLAEIDKIAEPISKRSDLKELDKKGLNARYIYKEYEIRFYYLVYSKNDPEIWITFKK
jgi:hypothetical protein